MMDGEFAVQKGRVGLFDRQWEGGFGETPPVGDLYLRDTWTMLSHQTRLDG